MNTLKKTLDANMLAAKNYGAVKEGDYASWMNTYSGGEWDEGNVIKFLIGEKSIYLYDNDDCMEDKKLHDLKFTREPGTKIITASLTDQPEPCLVEKYVWEGELYSLVFTRDVLLIPAQRENEVITIFAKVYDTGGNVVKIDKLGEYHFDRLQSLLQHRIVWREGGKKEIPEGLIDKI